MNAAIDKAKLSLDRFTEAYSQRASKPAEFFLKKPYPTPEGGDEHVWITVTGTNSHGFAGIVNNDVEHSKKVRLGDTVVVHPREVSDWFFVRDHVVHGAYTIRVLLRHETATERAEAIAHLGGTLAPENE